jgi:hypothetical protein
MTDSFAFTKLSVNRSRRARHLRVVEFDLPGLGLIGQGEP